MVIRGPLLFDEMVHLRNVETLDRGIGFLLNQDYIGLHELAKPFAHAMLDLHLTLQKDSVTGLIC